MFYKHMLSLKAVEALETLHAEQGAAAVGTTPDDDMDVLAALMLASGAVHVLQFGTFLGGSAVVLADLAKRNATPERPAKFVTVDPDDGYLQTAFKYLEISGGADISQPAMAFSTDPALIAELKKHKWDFIFLDTTHQYFDTVDEIRAIVPLCGPGTVFAFHDASSFAAKELDQRQQGGVQRAIREFCVLNPQWQSFIFQSPPFGKYGIGAIQKRNTDGR